MLEGRNGTNQPLIGIRQWIVEIHAAARDIAQKIAHKFDTNGLILAGEMQHTCNQAGYFIGEVPTQDGGFEANNH